MSESVRRRKYRWDRVLIESDRVLNPQFDDAVVYLTGAQIEMLRNVSQYLNRLDTYVTEYNPGYYIAPTAADYDDILEIVADLEEALMGNPNTIWGYTSVKILDGDFIKSGPGDHILYSGTVPEGEVWCLDSFVAWNDDTVCSKIELVFDHPAMEMVLYAKANPAATEQVRWNGKVTLSQYMRIYAKFYDCIDADRLYFQARGNIMTVPA